MSIDVRWDNEEKTIVYYTVHKGWNWPDLDAAMDQSHQLMNEVDHPVYSIIDFSGSGLLPKNPLFRGKRLAAKRHPNTAMAVFVAGNSFFQAMFGVFSRMYPNLTNMTQFTDTPEKAYAILEERLKITE